jgi:ubiquinone/menaquinone biosynthesis C-methylase UbiE
MSVTSTSINYWPQNSSAKLFWSQQELPPYRRLLGDTAAWLQPQPGQRWLDLGCGGGQLTKALWLRSYGTIAEIVGLDCAAANERAYARLRDELIPPPGKHIRFIAANFSDGLPSLDSDAFDGVVSGLAIQYAESYSPDEARWTTAAYDHALAEIYRVLKPDGRFVFSVNVPNPAWVKVAWQSLFGFIGARQPLRYLQKAWAMYRFGGWLKREARKGRFHFLHRGIIEAKLEATGFTDIEWRRTYAGQAYLFRCRK